MRGRIIELEVTDKRGKAAKTIPLYQYDYGQKLLIKGVELPEYYEVHFSNQQYGDAITVLGDSTGVLIPDSLVATGETIYVWLFLHDTSYDGETEYMGAIPVIKRAQPTDVTPTPEEQSIITEVIAALNNMEDDMSEQVQAAEAAKEAAQTAQTAAEGAATTASGYVDTVTAAQTAAEAAQAAAETAATSATASATSATSSANSANNALAEATNAKIAAVDAATSASTSATTATTASGNASNYATSAESAKVDAVAAKVAAEAAQTAAETAQGKAEDAQGAAETAQTAAEAAQTAAETAQGKAEDAQTAAESAQGSAEDSAEDSEAYAVGTRNGVDVESDDPAYENNAKYYAEEAATVLEDKLDAPATAGTAGQVLTSDGEGGQAWADPSGAIDDTAGEGDTDVTWSADKLDGEFTDVKSAYHGISTAQKDITGCMPIPMVANKYIQLSGSTIYMVNGHPAYTEGTTVYSCGYVACVEGDVFTVNGTGGGATRLWGFVDDEGNILSVAGASATESGLTLVAPDESAWFITHTNDDSISYKGNMLELIGELMIYPYESINKFGQGSISGTDGHIIESTTRIYTLDYIPFEDGLVLTCDKNIKWSLRYYLSNLEMQHADEDWRTVGGAVKATQPAIDKYFRINIAYDDNSTITTSDVITIKLWKTKQITDKTLSIDGKIADAKTVGDRLKELSSTPTPSSSMLGNATIRAAKTINFDDGTPPVIDWYLIQTVDSKFYRSKDLVSKEYLFTTSNSGMTGYVSNWSCAILPNNDVLFVADAAGLSTSTYGRLKDENRINPIVFLASENYAQAHQIDFGSSLKPCGWLNNVGFCTLPNGDFVFAEYTRGTVKTANVWLVSGDVTDPANWSVTWSVNIIDTMDSTTPGTKHCHEVMYDFFTGILYFGTGDSKTGSNNYYSTDGGETWTLLYGEDKNRCRRLNFIFTEDYVYWASDSWQADDHHFFIGERDNDGIVDVENATEISLTSGNGQACYGIVYLKEQNLIVMMDRIDDPVTNKLNWYCYDLTTGTVEKIGEIGSATGTLSYLGFRCRFIDFYPTGNAILTGFSPRKTSANEDTNRNKLCGNLGGMDGDGSTRINNLLLYVYKNGTDYSYRATTLWI